MSKTEINRSIVHDSFLHMKSTWFGSIQDYEQETSINQQSTNPYGRHLALLQRTHTVQLVLNLADAKC